MMLRNCLCGVLLVFVSLCLTNVHCEVFSALATLTKSLRHEKDLADGLRQYVELEKERLNQVLL